MFTVDPGQWRQDVFLSDIFVINWFAIFINVTYNAFIIQHLSVVSEIKCHLNCFSRQ